MSTSQNMNADEQWAEITRHRLDDLGFEAVAAHSYSGSVSLTRKQLDELLDMAETRSVELMDRVLAYHERVTPPRTERNA